MSAQDDRTARLVINLGAVSNVSLAVFKAGAGALTGSASLLADAVHSLADLASDGVTYASHVFARKPADPRFPYGRGRAEAFGSFLVSSTLVIAGASLGWQSLHLLTQIVRMEDTTTLVLAGRHAVEFLHNPTLAAIAIAGTVGSIAVKEGLYRWTMRIATKLRSSVLVANAWHHRVDAATSVVAAVGVTGALAGVPALDPLCAVVVSASIMQQGGSMCIQAVNELLDRNLDTDVLAGVEAIIAATPDVTRFQRLRARRVGPAVHVDLEIGLRPHLTISAAHHVADDFRTRVLAALPHVADVLVHTFPDEEVQAVYCADEACHGAAGGRGVVDRAGGSKGGPHSHHDAPTPEGAGEEHGSVGGGEHAASLAPHDHGHSHGAGRPPSVTASAASVVAAAPALRLSPAQVELQIRRAAMGVKEVRAVTHLRLHYGPASSSRVVEGGGGGPSVRVEMEVLLPLDFRLRDCVHAVRRVRSAVEALPFVSVADVHLEVEPA